MITARCSLCGAEDWRALPDPVSNCSITTAGNLLREPLSKAQCGRCGLLQRVTARFVGDSDFYEERYADYYGRPGAETYDAPRYAAMAEWMSAGLGSLAPNSILDVGCGAGWSMRATREKFPQAAIEGIEPSKINAERARQAGFAVRLGKIGASSAPPKKYDLVYANNVLQHVLSPPEFLLALRDYLLDKGLLVLVCPDATRPSSEMLWCDHNHSFRPEHLRELATQTGFRVHHWLPNPENITVLDKQLVVLAKGNGAHAAVGRTNAPSWTLTELYEERRRYIEAWRSTHQYLAAQARSLRTLNFGASSWTWLLAGYCPEYWSGVERCVVDQFSGHCLDKRVEPLAEIPISSGDGLVLGVNPVSQGMYAERFKREGRNIVRWDDFVHS